MGDEIVNLLINLGIEVDKEGNVKKSANNLLKLNNELERLKKEKASNKQGLKSALNSATPDNAKIEQYVKNLDEIERKLVAINKANKQLSKPRFETTGITPEQLKAANNVSSPINLPSTAKLINTQQAYDKNGTLSTIKVYQDVVEKDGQKLVKTYKEINGKVVNETEKLVNNTLTKTAKPKGGIEKFVNRVKNIVVYRLVRTVMSAIGRSITQGLNLIAVNNSGAREILTDFKSATTSLSISISTMLLPIMQSLSSMLTNIGDKFIDVANYMSRQNALTQGQATYYKINKKAVDDYAKSLTALSGNLSQLDKFATLSGTNNPILGGQVDVAESVGLDKDTENFVNGLKNLFKGLGTILEWVGNNFKTVMDLIAALVVGGLGAKTLLFIINLIKGFKDVVSWLKAIKLQTGLISAGFALLYMAFFSDLPVAIKTLCGALGGLAVALGVIFALKEGITKGGFAIASLVGVGTGIAAFAVSMGKAADSGSSATSSGLSSATNINSLMSGVASSGGYSQSSMVTSGTNNSVGDVYLDNHKVGQVVAQGAYSAGVKSGFYR